MPKFIIDKIGPIEHVDFTLNKVNMLIGPQSSGKSTKLRLSVSVYGWKRMC